MDKKQPRIMSGYEDRFLKLDNRAPRRKQRRPAFAMTYAQEGQADDVAVAPGHLPIIFEGQSAISPRASLRHAVLQTVRSATLLNTLYIDASIAESVTSPLESLRDSCSCNAPKAESRPSIPSRCAAHFPPGDLQVAGSI